MIRLFTSLLKAERQLLPGELWICSSLDPKNFRKQNNIVSSRVFREIPILSKITSFG
jgi:hypothetical protein